MKLVKYILLGMFGLLSSVGARADFMAFDCLNVDGCYEISGSITQEDAQIAKHVVSKELSKKYQASPFFYLNSKGGDVFAAISIGRELRKIFGVGVVMEDSVCLSSCVFILAGAAQRKTLGKVGIHRPYSISTERTDFHTAQDKHNKLMGIVKNYLVEMNIPPSLYEAMIRISPEEIRVLSDAELAIFGLDKNDPVYDDVVDTNYANQFGLTKAEYLARKKKVADICVPLIEAGAPEFYTKCWGDIMKGVW